MIGNTSPLASIVIPCYGQAHYLPQAIDSALAQTYPAVEVIVINDGSPDNTREVARSYGDRITYLEQENRGLAAARNAAIVKSKGGWLQFLDADDLLHRHKIQWQLEDLAQSGARLGYCCTAVFEQSLLDKQTTVNYPGQIEDMFLALASLWNRSPIPTHSVLVSRRIVETYGGFPEYMQANEDRLFFTKIAMAGERFHFTPIVGAFYRTHPNSMNRDARRMLAAHHAYLETVWEMAAKGQTPTHLVRAVILRSLLHIVESYARRGCSWDSLSPVLQFYLDVNGCEERRGLQRVLPDRWMRQIWLMKQRTRMRVCEVTSRPSVR